MSCLGESCTSVDDCKGSLPSVECINGTCQCAVGYTGTDLGQCFEGENTLFIECCIHRIYLKVFKRRHDT